MAIIPLVERNIARRLFGPSLDTEERPILWLFLGFGTHCPFPSLPKLSLFIRRRVMYCALAQPVSCWISWLTPEVNGRAIGEPTNVPLCIRWIFVCYKGFLDSTIITVTFWSPPTLLTLAHFGKWNCSGGTRHGAARCGTFTRRDLWYDFFDFWTILIVTKCSNWLLHCEVIVSEKQINEVTSRWYHLASSCEIGVIQDKVGLPALYWRCHHFKESQT